MKRHLAVEFFCVVAENTTSFSWSLQNLAGPGQDSYSCDDFSISYTGSRPKLFFARECELMLKELADSSDACIIAVILLGRIASTFHDDYDESSKGDRLMYQESEEF